jgi:hypothetical protein
MDHQIEWLTPEGAPAPDRGKKSVESTVSHLPKVKDAVYHKATQMALEAAASLATHRRKGRAHINVTAAPPRELDCWVELLDDDPGGKDHVGKGNTADRSAMSIEFGWTQTHAFGKRLATPVRHEGLHILGNVMNRAASRYRGPRD